MEGNVRTILRNRRVWEPACGRGWVRACVETRTRHVYRGQTTSWVCSSPKEPCVTWECVDSATNVGRGLSSREGWRLGNRRARIVAEGGYRIAKEVRLRDRDITPVDYCPCCSKLLYQDSAHVGLAPVMVRTKTSHCLKRTWLWRSRERRGEYAGKGSSKDYDIRSWTAPHRFYGTHILRPRRK